MARSGSKNLIRSDKGREKTSNIFTDVRSIEHTTLAPGDRATIRAETPGFQLVSLTDEILL